jgi:RNA polymerase sigma-70 factor, ECF subfamily
VDDLNTELPGGESHPSYWVATDEQLLVGLRTGDEQAFVTLVTRYQGSMRRLARTCVRTSAVADEVVQDTWLAVVRGVDNFEERSSFKTWLMRILMNRARTTGIREARSEAIGEASAVDHSRFDHSGQWTSPPQQWTEDIDDRVRAGEMAAQIQTAMEDLPPQQRVVVTLHDMDGLTSKEVCTVLSISESNQRVLLHRGRSRLRQALETEFWAE